MYTSNEISIKVIQSPFGEITLFEHECGRVISVMANVMSYDSINKVMTEIRCESCDIEAIENIHEL